MADPKAPQLPANLPPDLRRFLECKSTSVTLADGPMTWVDGSPPMKIRPGSAPGSATIDVEILGMTVSIPASVQGGALKLDLGKYEFALPKETASVADDLNAWFKANGYKWGPPAFGKGTTTLTKVWIAAPATVNPPVAPPAPVAPKPAPPVTPPVTPPTNGGSQPLPYAETKVEVPTLPKSTFDPPKAAPSGASAGTTGPYGELDKLGQALLEAEAKEEAANKAKEAAAKTVPAPSGGGKPPVTGAGGPGGPKAPTGMGRLGVLTIVAVAIAVIVGGVIFLGGGKPAGTPGPGESDVAAGTEVVETTGPEPAACDAAAALQQFGADGQRYCPKFQPDVRMDWIEYSAVAASIQPDAGDITSWAFQRVQVGPTFIARMLAGCDVRQGVYCAETKPTPGQYGLWGFEFAANVDQQAAAYYEVAVAMQDTTPGNGVGATTWSSSAGDPLSGANLAYSLRLPSLASKSAIAGLFRLAYDKDSDKPFFFQSTSASFAFTSGRFAFLAVPVAELDGVMTYRQFTFYQEDGSGPSGVDLAPNLPEMPVPMPSDPQLLEFQ